MANDQQLENAEGAVNENETNCGTKRTFITSVVIKVTLDGVKAALVNFNSDGEAMFI